MDLNRTAQALLRGGLAWVSRASGAFCGWSGVFCGLSEIQNLGDSPSGENDGLPRPKPNNRDTSRKVAALISQNSRKAKKKRSERVVRDRKRPPVP